MKYKLEAQASGEQSSVVQDVPDMANGIWSMQPM